MRLAPLPQTLLVSPEWIAEQRREDWLTPSELTLWQSFPSQRRQADWLAGRLALKQLIQEQFGLAPLACTVGRDGPAPRLDGTISDLTISLSHSNGWGAASWEWASRGAVGVDFQYHRAEHPRLAARVLTAAEQAQISPETDALLFWSLKEAAIKARRQRWGRALRELEVTLTGPGTASIALAGEPPLTATYVRLPEGWLARAVRL